MYYCADTGVGISKEEIDKIFDRFYRVKTVRKGWGRHGNSVCPLLWNSSTLLHGNIEVTSEKGTARSLL
jgi:signal transduction histidine kinase